MRKAITINIKSFEYSATSKKKKKKKKKNSNLTVDFIVASVRYLDEVVPSKLH